MPAPPRPPKKFVADPFEYHEEIELEIESLANLGQGVGRTADGWVVFVPFTIPGERVKARIFRNHKAHSDADLVEVITPDSARQERGVHAFRHLRRLPISAPLLRTPA